MNTFIITYFHFHGMRMACFEILIEIHPAKRTEFLQAFEMIRSDKLETSERFDIGLFEQVNRTNTFLWKERWENNESMQHYFESNTFRMMIGATRVLGGLVYQKMFRLEEDIDNGA